MMRNNALENIVKQVKQKRMLKRAIALMSVVVILVTLHNSSNLKPPEGRENEAQKEPEPLLQIQCQNRQMNHDFAGMLKKMLHRRIL